MIETYCRCLAPVVADESAVGTVASCPKCKTDIILVAGEFITPGSALGDFDARLIITHGPTGVGQVMALGGLPDLQIGKSPDRHIHLGGTGVSRAHAKLTRLDFGPSRWQLADTQSRNGLFINDEQVTEAELRDGDVIHIGEFQLLYLTKVPKRIMPLPAADQVSCPGCREVYSIKTQICVACGINLKTGKPMVTSRELDEDDIAIRVHTWVRIACWFIWLGLFPIASEAFGTKKAISIWWITGITVFTSLLFFIPFYSGGVENPAARPWVMWTGTTNGEAEKMHHLFRHISHGRVDDATIDMIVDKQIANQGEFHIYQLLTQALLHGGFIHLAGNLVFLLVFGIRVNELIGNWKMAVIYPVLAVSSAAIYLFAARNDPLHASLGASGAIMGLAGMYFVFFPTQKVHMVFWFWRFYYKVFRMSGFWLLVSWVGLNDLLPTLLHGSQTGDGVAHWAHLGGFLSGFAIAVGLLVTRQVNAHGSDLLSMMLGPTAWKILGRPGVQPA